MRNEQRFFLSGVLFAPFFFSALCFAGLPKKVEIADGRIAFELPDGWRETDLNAGAVLAGFTSSDKRASAFFREIDAGVGGSMKDIIDATIANFKKTLDVKKVDESKTGQVSGPEKKWPSIFTTAEADIDTGEKEFPMKFYLLVFDTGTSLYFLQASTTLPVRGSHEQMIFDLIRSIVAKS